MEIEKNISLFIEQQFPSVYREDGPELVQLVKDYYKFLEVETNQAHHVSRRFFEYKDVDTTIKEMLIFFQKKYLADLPLRENIVQFMVKNILDLYRRKGTSAGIETFFSIFFNEYDIEIVYPAEKMLKVSNSKWRRGVYLQLFPNNNYFLSKTDKAYTYADLISLNIVGSVSGAKAAVNRVNFILLNGSKTPIIYIDEVQGSFQKYDDLLAIVNGELVSFGRVNGSLNAFEITDDYPGTSGNEIGDVYNVVANSGDGGKVVVTAVSNDIEGEIRYEYVDGGYGYTVENTKLLVSDQTLIIDNPNLEFVLYERLRDAAGNEGIVIGQNEASVGVLMNAGQEFPTDLSQQIFAIDRAPTTPLAVELITEKNSSSPGILYPDGGDADSDVIASLSETTQIEVITDLLAPYMDDFVGQNKVPLNSADYNTAGDVPMSGTASPVNLNTPLDEAFDIQTLTIGKINLFRNVSPGGNYTNDVFARAQDSVIKAFDRKNQILKLASGGNAGIFNIGEIIEEENTGIRGEVKFIDTAKGFISVSPFDYYGFNAQNDIIRPNGDTFEVSTVEIDYDSRAYGDNAIVNAQTEFSIGKISEVAIINSGFGYVDNSEGTLVDEDGNIQASGIISSFTQGFTEGYWSDETSHLNGFIQKQTTNDTPILPTEAFALEVGKLAVGLATSFVEFSNWGASVASDGFAYLDINKDGSITTADALAFLKLAVNAPNPVQAEVDRWNDIIAPSMKTQLWFPVQTGLYNYVVEYNYYTSGMRIQDSDFYQEYSYQIKSTLNRTLYEENLKRNVHLAGTRMFGDFVYKVEIPAKTKARFSRFFNDDGRGSPLDIADIDTLEASVTNFTVDSTSVTADHEPI